MICEKCIHNSVCTYGEARSNGLYCTGEKCRQFHDKEEYVAINDVVDKIAKFFEDSESNWYDLKKGCWLTNGRSDALRNMLYEAIKA